MTITVRPLSPGISEQSFMQCVIDLAILYGWRVTHHRPAMTRKGWRTAVQGHAGVPDLILARAGVVLLAELKSNTGRPTVEQKAWLAELGPSGRLWTPASWPQIVTELTAPRGVAA